jgi:sulfatase maturation enzyme AslB (radical SAM superfamily)
MSELWKPPSDTACKLKWAWSTVFLNSGKTKSCFHNPSAPFDTESFNFHNIPIKIADRRQMLEGTWPSGCAYCSRTEALGGKSDRQSHNHIPALIPDNLDTTTSPKLLEIFFNNTCNLSCLYCGPALSSSWLQEVSKFGTIEYQPKLSQPFEIDRDQYLKTLERFFNWFEQNKHTLERLNILGGEPFLLKETDRLLEVLSTGTANLELNLVSNLIIEPTKFDEYVNKLVKLIKNKNISSVVIMASIDGWGPAVDFQRYGIDRQLWLRNFNKLLNTPEIKLDINVAITCLTIPSMPELIKLWNTWNETKVVGLQGTRVFEPDFLAPEVLPAKLNKQHFEEALALIPEDTWYKDWSKKRFSNLLPVFDKYPDGDIEKMKILKLYLDELSRRRSLDWAQIFPEIYKELSKL